MDKKTALVLFVAIVSFTIVSLSALWLDPFQDSAVGGQITGTVKIKNVTIPLGDIIKLARGDYTRPYPIGNSDSIDLSGIRDLDIGDIQVDINIQSEGKNIEKLLRGIFYSPPSFTNVSYQTAPIQLGFVAIIGWSVVGAIALFVAAVAFDKLKLQEQR